MTRWLPILLLLLSSVAEARGWGERKPPGGSATNTYILSSSFPSIQAAVDSVDAGLESGIYDGEIIIQLPCGDVTLTDDPGVQIGDPSLAAGAGMKSGITIQGCGWGALGATEACGTTVIYDGADGGTMFQTTGRHITYKDFCLDGDGPAAGNAGFGFDFVGSNVNAATIRSIHMEKIYGWDIDVGMASTVAAGATDSQFDSSLFTLVQFTGGETCVRLDSSATQSIIFEMLVCNDQTGKAVDLRQGSATFVDGLIVANPAADLDDAFYLEEGAENIVLLSMDCEIADGDCIDADNDTDTDGTYERAGTLSVIGGRFALCGATGVDVLSVRGGGTIDVRGMETTECDPDGGGPGTAPASIDVVINGASTGTAMRLASPDLRGVNQFSTSTTYTVSGVTMSAWKGDRTTGGEGRFSYLAFISNHADSGSYSTGNEVCGSIGTQCEGVYDHGPKNGRTYPTGLTACNVDLTDGDYGEALCW